MSKIKLKTVHPHKKNQKNILPIVGLVEFDEHGHIEIEENLAEELILNMPEFSLFNPDETEEEIKIKIEENDLGKGGDENKIEPQITENDVLGENTTIQPVVNPSTSIVEGEENKIEEVKKTPEEIEEVLLSKSAAELKEILSQYPEEETKELKKKEQYIAYLITKLS